MKRSNIRVSKIACMLLLVTFMPGPRVSAQVLYGSIVGRVTDTGGASVAGASVAILSSQTGFSRATTTNDLGLFDLSSVPSSTYIVTISKEGFASSVTNDFVVAADAVERLDARLRVRTVEAQVTVNDVVQGIQTDSAEVRDQLDAVQMDNLPVPPGRNYQQLFATLPGFAPAIQGNSITANPSRSLDLIVNGAAVTGSKTRIDGANSNAIYVSENSAYVPNLESIESVDVVTNSFDAEQGLAGGAAINVHIKSGTNQIHGSAFEYHSDNALQAKPYFSTPGERNPKYILNQFGGTIGGPIVRNKLFYFASFEGYSENDNAAMFATVPTAAMRVGDMSASPTPVYDPTTGNADGTNRTAFPGNIIPASEISPIAQKLIALIPSPTFPNLLANNYFDAGAFTNNRHTGDGKIDWNINHKLYMFARVGIMRYNENAAPVFGALGGPFPGIGGAYHNPSGGAYTGSVGANYTVTPHFVVDTNFATNLLDTGSVPIRFNEQLGLNYLGIPGTNGPQSIEGGWPQFLINDFTYLGSRWPLIWHDWSYVYSANASWTRGSHNIRFGVITSRLDINHQQPQLLGAQGNFAGQFVFTGGPTSLNGGSSPNEFNSFASFLLGLPFEENKMTTASPAPITSRAWQQGLYVRDQWQAKQNLTLSYGLRWEYYPMPTRASRGLERYDPSTNTLLVCGVGSVPSDCGVTTSKKLFSPRLGVAYRLTDTFVLRGGYGINYDPYNAGITLLNNYPSLVALNTIGQNSYQAVGTLAQGIPPIAIPSLGNGVISVPGSIAVYTTPRSFRRGYVQGWNLTVQKQLGWGFTGQAGYVGTRSINAIGTVDLNASQIPGGGQAAEPLFQLYGRTAPTLSLQPLGSSHYDSLQTSLERRFAHGFQLSAAYTISKAEGICCGSEYSGGDWEPAIQATQFKRLNWALTDFDVPQDFQVTAVMELPFGKQKRWLSGSGIASALLSGWQINTVFSAFSGTPFTVLADGTSLNAPGNTQVANQVKQHVAKLGGIGPGNPYYDPSAFAPVTTTSFGDAGFDSLRGPGTVNLDLGVFRLLHAGERFTIQVRAEAFNATNTPHFGPPGSQTQEGGVGGTTVGQPGFMEITQTNPNLSGVRNVDQRQFQFGLRFGF
jgi:hypothetical protein